MTLAAIDPVRLEPYRRACEEQARAAGAESAAADLRGRALAELHDEGFTYGQIAAATGLTRARVEQLARRGRKNGEAAPS